MTTLPDYLWHGTTSYALKSITRDGLFGSYEFGDACAKSHLAFDRETAAWYAMSGALRPGLRHPVLLRIPTAVLSRTSLRPDIDAAVGSVSSFPRHFPGNDGSISMDDICQHVAAIGNVRSRLTDTQIYEMGRSAIYARPIPTECIDIDTSLIDIRLSHDVVHEWELSGLVPETVRNIPAQISSLSDKKETPDPIGHIPTIFVRSEEEAYAQMRTIFRDIYLAARGQMSDPASDIPLSDLRNVVQTVNPLGYDNGIALDVGLDAAKGFTKKVTAEVSAWLAARRLHHLRRVAYPVFPNHEDPLMRTLFQDILGVPGEKGTWLMFHQIHFMPEVSRDALTA